MGETKDLYAVLGVARDADRDVIRKAYRKLARESHPDLNPGDEKAEARFKEIAHAWEVLEDDARRKAYDEFGEISLEAGFDADEARKAREAFGAHFGGGAGFDFRGQPGSGPGGQEFHFGDLDDLLGGLFGGAAPGAGPRGMRMRGQDLEAHLVLEFDEAVRGGEKRLTLGRPGPDGVARPETLTVRIPPGVHAGGSLRLAGKGAPGHGGGPAGDLHVRLEVRPHPVFRREGRRDLVFDLPLSVREATLGAKVEVPTLEGRVTLTVPTGTDSGAKLRLKGKGVPGAKGAPAGDLFARVQIRVPRELDDDGRAALEALERLEDPGLRKELFA